MSEDYVYENAPLIEVIAEVHWKLQKLASIPDGAVDPFFQATKGNFPTKLNLPTDAEQLVPDDIPLELIPHRPIIRFKQKGGAWPMYQLGPGLFTANIIPPYKGWREFRSFIHEGLKALFDAYPDSEKNLQIERIELRYIDGFTKAHGFENYAKFLAESLQVKFNIADGMLEDYFVNENDMLSVVEVRANIKEPANSVGTIKVAPGRVKNDLAAIAEFKIMTALRSDLQKCDPIMSWFDAAHETVRKWFDTMISKDVKTALGEKRNINN